MTYDDGWAAPSLLCSATRTFAADEDPVQRLLVDDIPQRWVQVLRHLCNNGTGKPYCNKKVWQVYQRRGTIVWVKN